MDFARTNIQRIAEILFFGEQSPPIAGGRFLPPFATEIGFFCLRTLGACAVLLSGFLIQPLIGLSPIAFALGYFVVQMILLFLKNRKPSETHYWRIDTLQLCLDITFATMTIALFAPSGSGGALLFIVSLLQAAYRGPRAQWLLGTVLVFASSILGFAWPMLSSASIAPPPSSSIIAAILSSLMWSASLLVMSCAIRLYRNTQLQMRLEAETRQMEVEEAQRNLTVLMDNIPDSIYFKDPAGYFTRVSQSLTARLNPPKGKSILGSTDFDFFVDEDARQKFEDEKRVMLGQAMVAVEEREAFRNGSVYWVSTTKMPLKDKAGRVIGTFGISRDITERREAQIRLTASEYKYRLIVENASDIIFIRKPSGEFLAVNRAVQVLLNYNPGDLVGRNILEIIAPEYRESFTSRLLRKDKKAKKVTREEIAFIAKDGRTVYFEFTARTFLDRQRKEPIVVSIGYDVTQRREGEEKLRRLLKEKEILLHEIHHRTKNDLQIARSILSHQSRFLSDEKAQTALADCGERIRSMMEIYEDLLVTESLQQIPIKRYLERQTLGAAGNFRYHGISVSPEIEDITLGVDAALPCGQIVNELVTNCFKHAFTSQKGSIRVTLKRIEPGMLEFSCEDDGVGLMKADAFSNPQTCGCKLVSLWVTQLKGTLTVSNSRGTQIRIRFLHQKT